jgi:hypothetical protein
VGEAALITTTAVRATFVRGQKKNAGPKAGVKIEPSIFDQPPEGLTTMSGLTTGVVVCTGWVVTAVTACCTPC